MPTVKQLKAELAAAKAEINRLQQQNASLLERLVEAPLPITAPMRVSTTTVSYPLAFPSSLQLESYTSCPPSSELESPLHQKAFKSKYALLLPSQTASARTFSSPSTNQGFKYLYLSIQRRLPIRQIRSLLRRLHINSSHVLDIHYPDRHLVAFLIHNDYEAEVRSQLEKFEIPLRDDYDPQDPNNLRSLLP